MKGDVSAFTDCGGVEIIRATPDLAETLTTIALAAKRFWGYPEQWIQIWTPLLTVSPEYLETHHAYVALKTGRPVGFYVLSLEQQVARLEHLWVLPTDMRQGVGRRLFLHVLAQCKEMGARTLEVESDPNAEGFYRAMGARKVGEAHSDVSGEPRSLPIMEITIFD